jgi:hypothetical protein
MPSPPLDLQGLAAAALEVLTTFLTVSYLASTATEGWSSALNLRGKLLMRTIQELLNETHTSAPVTLAIYNNFLFNPRATERADTIAAVKSLPAVVDSLTFARALMDAVGLRGNDPQQMLEAISASSLDPTLQTLARNLVEHHAEEIRQDNLTNMQRSIANWYERAVGHRADDYRRLTQLSNFITGLLVAALLGLSPLPKSLMESGLLGHFSAQFSSEWPLKLFGYIIVAVSTLYGAPFWFSLINKISPVKPTGVRGDAAAGPPTGAFSNGTPTTQPPPPDQSPGGPAPATPSTGSPSGPPEASSSAPP